MFIVNYNNELNYCVSTKLIIALAFITLYDEWLLMSWQMNFQISSCNYLSSLKNFILE